MFRKSTCITAKYFEATWYIFRGYYTLAGRYEFYVLVARTIDVLFIVWSNLFNKSKNDTTPTKVTFGKYATRAPDEVAYGIYE